MLRTLVASAITFAALGLLILARYPLRHYAYPIGWDSPQYVWRAAAVTVDGLDRIGGIRAGSPLLVGVLMQVTGQNGFTMVAIAMAVLGGIVALGAAAMVRAALAVRAVWVPVIGVLTWLAFGHIGMIGGHLDNVLNAAFVVPAFAAAVGFAGGKRGAVAVTLLFMASVLAEWPFHLLALAVFLLGLGAFVWPDLRAHPADRSGLLPIAGPLAAAAGVSFAFMGLTLLWRPPGGGVGLRAFGTKFRAIVRQRFFERLKDTTRYYAFPLAVAGAWFATRAPVGPRREPARRLFLCLMRSWLAVTVLAAVAQVLDFPVAGARLLNYFFAVPLLAGVFIWGITRYLAGRWRMLAGVVGAAIALGAIAGFGSVAWQGERGRKPWIPPAAVGQVAAAGQYAERFAPGRPLVFLITKGDLSWRTVQASLPPPMVKRTDRFIGTLTEFESSGGRGDAVAIVVQRLNRGVYDEARGAGGWTPVAPGVLEMAGPAPTEPVQAVAPRGNFRIRSLVWITGAVILVLAVAGSGWAVGLLPPDPVLGVLLSPALGAAMIVLLGVVWDRVGLGLSRGGAWGLVVLATAAGWGTAWGRRRVSSRPRSS